MCILHMKRYSTIWKWTGVNCKCILKTRRQTLKKKSEKRNTNEILKGEKIESYYTLKKADEQGEKMESYKTIKGPKGVKDKNRNKEQGQQRENSN